MYSRGISRRARTGKRLDNVKRDVATALGAPRVQRKEVEAVKKNHTRRALRAE
jgi:hypothetical protein